ncbi:MAG: hypothetical protein ABIF92_02275 [archaeon]
MKLDKSVFSIAVVAVLILLVVSMIFLGFFVKSETPPIEIPDDYYKCGNTLVPFRANITDCAPFPIQPNDFAFEKLVLNPLVENVYILVDPHGSSGLGLSAYEIFKTLNGLLIPSGVVYTEYVENQSEVSVMSLENSSEYAPVIWLRDNQDKNLIEVTENAVIVYAKTPYDMDAAACKLAIIAINSRFDCDTEE